MEKVLVTGGSGYIALHCIAELLKENYHVRTSLRNMERKEEVQKSVSKYLNENNSLEFCKLDLLSDCLLYTSPSPRDAHESRMPSSA